MKYKNILLIDDDLDDQEIFLAAVEDVSCTIKCIAECHAAVALQKLMDKTITPDLIFLDLNMPLMNGTEFLMEYNRDIALKGIPVVIYSTSSHAEAVEETRQLGAINFFSKPDDYNKLVETLTSFL